MDGAGKEHDELAAAIRELAQGFAQLAEAILKTCGRAGAARGSEPFGSQVGTEFAFDFDSTDTTIDRSIRFDPIDRSEFSWEEIEKEATKLAKWVRCKPGPHWRRDRGLLARAMILSKTRLQKAWLDQALQAVENHGPTNSAAYFRHCLVEGLHQVDRSIPDGAKKGEVYQRAAAIFRELEDLVPALPESWFRRQEPKAELDEETPRQFTEEDERRIAAKIAQLPPDIRKIAAKVDAKIKEFGRSA